VSTPKKPSGKGNPPPVPPVEESPLTQAKDNPFRFFSLEDAAEIFGFGRNTMTALADAGAPIIARKCNPQLLLRWLEENAEKVGKIRGE